MNHFYVYLYSNPIDLVPFYVGKGKGSRYNVLHKMKSGNSLLKNVIRKIGPTNVLISFLAFNVTEEEAFYWERYYIKLYGRRDLGTGTLCNLTDGGEGPSGWVASDSYRKLVSSVVRSRNLTPEGVEINENNRIRMLGNSLNKGRVFSVEWRRKLGEASRKNRLGKKMSSESRERLSKSLSGRKITNEVKQKISSTLKGRVFTQLHKEISVRR